MRWIVYVTMGVGLLLTTGAKSQVVTPLNGDPTYLAVTTTNPLPPGGGLGGLGNGYFVSANQGIPLSYFATSGSVSALSGRLDAALAAFGPTTIDNLNNQLVALNSRVTGAYDVATIAAAMKDAIPNAGDRFAIRLNAAAMDGYAAGAIGFSLNVTDSARVSINYGRGRTQNIVSGGLNLSFH